VIQTLFFLLAVNHHTPLVINAFQPIPTYSTLFHREGAGLETQNPKLETHRKHLLRFFAVFCDFLHEHLDAI
jgi:hypothetical protein